LKGKILNVQKARIHKILESDEVRSIITALGVGFGEDFAPEKVRYGKIILMADADVDGSHIRTLILTLFFVYMRELIDNGNIYIAQPPLYKIKKGQREAYAFNDQEREELVERFRKESKSKTADNIAISRFKGLGEMNPEQLWETTMNPDTRTLLQVTIENAANAARLFEVLMGDQVEPRRNFIETNAQYVKNLDV
jgi:DNA gyrase subunit B